MYDKDRGQNQILTGRIIHVLEENNQNVLKVRVLDNMVEVKVDDFKEFYLGDEVNIDCEIIVNKITPKVSIC